MKGSKTWRVSLQSLKERLLRFTVIRRVFGSSSKSAPKKPPQCIPSNIFHTCNETPLAAFIDCACDHNYRSLIKYGNTSQTIIARAWEMIYSEYSDTSGNPTSKALINLSKDISYHDAKLRAVGLCLKVLSHGPNKDCIHVLRDIYHYDYPFDITRPEEYARSLEAIATKSGSIVMTLQIKKAEYDRESSKVSGKPMTRESFYDILAVLFEHFKARIDPKTTTVTEFVSYKKRYDAEMKALVNRNESEKRAHTANMRNV